MALGYRIMFLFSVLACEVKVNTLESDLKAQAVLHPCNANYRLVITDLQNCKNKIDVLIRSTINQKTKAAAKIVKINKIRNQASGEDLVLLKPLVIELQRKKPKLVYQLKQLKMVNNKAYEMFFDMDSRINNEDDIQDSVEKICGSNSKMEDQGFSCNCDKRSSKKAFHTRREQACSKKLGANKNLHMSVHCLKFHPVWYSVNELAAPAIEAEVVVSVHEMESEKSFGDIQIGVINSPPNQKSANGQVMVSLVHDKTPKIDPLQHKQNRLLIPAQDPMSTEKEFLQLRGNASEFLVVDKKLVYPSGEVCDSIGVSYRAFVTQKNRCSSRVQSCLDNQPMHFWSKDATRKLKGKQTKFFLSGFPNTSKPRLFQRSHDIVLSLDEIYSHNSSILVQINADQLKMEKIRSKAEIISVNNGDSGTIKVTLYNPGLVSQLFTVHLHSCNTSVSQSYRKLINIYPHQLNSVVFALKNTSYWKRIVSCTVSVQSTDQNMTERKFWYIEGETCVCSSLIECRCQNKPYDFTVLENQSNLYSLTHLRQRKGLFEGPYDFNLILCLVLILIFYLGLNKALLGIVLPIEIGQWGLCLFVKSIVLTSYHEKDLKGCIMNLDERGKPVHPKTRKPVQILPTCTMYMLNIVFGFYLLFIPLHWLFLNLCHKNEEYKSKREENLWRHKLNSCASDNEISTATESMTDENSLQIHSDELRDKNSFQVNSDELRDKSSFQVNSDELSQVYSDVALQLYKIQRKNMVQQKESCQSMPVECEEDFFENHSGPKFSRSTIFSQKDSLKNLLQTDPVYCNFETSPSALLRNSGDSFSLCGTLVRNDKKYKFQLGVYNTQTCHCIGTDVQRLKNPIRILHPHQFTQTMTASEVYRMITIQPSFACLNSEIDSFYP